MDASGSRMEYEQFAQDPLHRPLHFTTAEEIEQAMRLYGLTSYELRQLGTGPFLSDWAVLEKDGVELFSDRYNKGFSLLLHPPEDMVGLLFAVSANGALLASGHNVANDKLLFIPKGCATDMTAPQLSGSEAITLSEERFLEIATLTAPGFRPPETVAAISGHTSRLHKLRRAIIKYLAHPEWDPLGEQLHNLVTATIFWMANATVDSIDATAAHVAIARRARDYLEANYRYGVRIEDLCRVTGVGVRTLQRSFREYFDLTISQYLKTLRLDRAHRSLVAGRGNGFSVAEVALGHGFAHLGRFSVEFKQRFGTSPNQTLLGGKARAKAPGHHH